MHEDYCNFENGLCPGWYQSYTDDFDWTLRSGPTWSYWTGPSSGHGGYGKFVVYINAICIFNLTLNIPREYYFFGKKLVMLTKTEVE